PARWLIRTDTRKQTTAILHHGKYRHDTKPRKAISMREVVNFMMIVIKMLLGYK
ncbi:MAG: hypothetical protein JST02_01665, partial [Bacteroidetes bacterium]|nr:hypothetical protein [Bacteroidota bacterium]